ICSGHLQSSCTPETQTEQCAWLRNCAVRADQRNTSRFPYWPNESSATGRGRCGSSAAYTLRNTNRSLPRQLSSKSLLPFCHILLVAIGIDKSCRDAFHQTGIFGFHVEVIAMGAKKIVTGQ